MKKYINPNKKHPGMYNDGNVNLLHHISQWDSTEEILPRCMYLKAEDIAVQSH